MTATTAEAPARFQTREEWLVAAVEAFEDLFSEIGETIPSVRVSVGWPGGRGRKAATIGQCWASSASADGIAQVFISPVLEDAAVVLSTLVHEIVHAVDDCESGHRGRFAKMAKALGLVGPMTATTAGDDLAARLAEIADGLGAYPHAALARAADSAEGPKKQGTRMLKVQCPESGYIVRTTAKWLEEVGEPLCPCHKEPMLRA